MEYLTDTANGCMFVEGVVAARDPLPLRWYSDFDFGLVRRGVVVRERIDHRGRGTAVDFAGPSSLVPLGPEHGATPEVSAYAATDVSICLLTHRSLVMHREQSCYRDMHILELHALERMERLIEARSRPTATERLAALLCTLADTLCPGQQLEVLPPGLQRSDMAALLGMRRETLSRALGELATSGVVRRDVEGIRIVDRRGLEGSGAPERKRETRISGVRLRIDALRSEEDVDTGTH